MKLKIWMRRILFRWTEKGSATRQLARNFEIKERDAFELVALVEASALDVARQLLDEQRKARVRATHSSPRYDIGPHRPPNQYTSGARLSS